MNRPSVVNFVRSRSVTVAPVESNPRKPLASQVGKCPRKLVTDASVPVTLPLNWRPMYPPDEREKLSVPPGRAFGVKISAESCTNVPPVYVFVPVSRSVNGSFHVE